LHFLVEVFKPLVEAGLTVVFPQCFSDARGLLPLNMNTIKLDCTRKTEDVRNLEKKVIEDEKLSEALEGILSKKDEVRSKSFKILMRISEEQPKVLYPRWDYLADLLESDNHYQRYISINILANLAKVDTKNKFEKIFDKYFSNIDGDRTMVAGQAALNSGKIAKAKPNLQAKITNRLLNIAKTHQGKQIDLIKAYVMGAFNEYFDESSDKNKILDFVKAELESKSPKTRKVAKEFLKKKEKSMQKS
jgi:hypothetical protein